MRALRARVRRLTGARAMYLALRVIRSPRFKPTVRFVRANGLTARAGPFSGLRYPRRALWRVPTLVSKLVGSYEAELHRAIEEATSRHPPLLVNIGAADGYYAVGLARRCPAAEVIAFECDSHAAATCLMLAQANGVSARVHMNGLCTVERLAQISPPSGTVVVSDCEGAEFSLIDPVRVPWLTEATLIVEVHEDVDTSEGLGQRLDATHEITILQPVPRYPFEFGGLRDTPGLTLLQKGLLLLEARMSLTNWLVATPRTSARAG